MGEISDALVRAREEEDRAPREKTPDARAPRSHPPLYERRDPEDRRAEDRASNAPRHGFGALNQPEPAPDREPQAASAPPELRQHDISDETDETWVRRLCAVDPDGEGAVRLRHFAVRVRGLLDQRPRQSVLVTSAVSGEGKTTVSTNLALALASIAPECRIALVDFDLHRGRVAHALGYESRKGVEDVLAGAATLEEVCVRTNVPGLDFFPTARSVADAHGLLGRSAENLFRQLHARYDYVVCDGPPVLPVPDVPLLTEHVGGCLAVIAAGRTRHSAFRELLELVPRSAWLGTFLNEARTAVRSKRKYGYYGYGQGDAADALDEADDDRAENEQEALASPASAGPDGVDEGDRGLTERDGVTRPARRRRSGRRRGRL